MECMTQSIRLKSKIQWDAAFIINQGVICLFKDWSCQFYLSFLYETQEVFQNLFVL